MFTASFLGEKWYARFNAVIDEMTKQANESLPSGIFKVRQDAAAASSTRFL